MPLSRSLDQALSVLMMIVLSLSADLETIQISISMSKESSEMLDLSDARYLNILNQMSSRLRSPSMVKVTQVITILMDSLTHLCLMQFQDSFQQMELPRLPSRVLVSLTQGKLNQF
jgi:hypothetical protein